MHFELENSTTLDVAFNATIIEELPASYSFLTLVLVPISCIFGNSLVVAAVIRTKGLQSATNYLLVSLAVADLMVGICVMPFSIYLAVNNLHWHIPFVLCLTFCVLDVAASTSSIVNLVIISVDRLVAATRPAEYKSMKHKRRVNYAICLCWAFSVAVGAPLGIGLNAEARAQHQRDHHCGIVNPLYMLCSSIFAFYIPCVVMLCTYSYIFITLKRRLRAIQLQELAAGQLMQLGADVGNIAQAAIQQAIGMAYGGNARRMISWEKPLLQQIEETAAENASQLSEGERKQLATILEAVDPSDEDEDEEEDDDETVNAAGPSTSHTNRSCLNVPKKSMHNDDDDVDGHEEEADDQDPETGSLLDAFPLAKCSQTSQHSFLSVPKTSGLQTRRTYGSDQSLAIVTHKRSMSYSDSLVSSASSLLVPLPKESLTRRHSGGSNLPDIDKIMTRTESFGKSKQMRRLSHFLAESHFIRRGSFQVQKKLYTLTRRESLAQARQKLTGLKSWALDLLAKLKSKQGMQIRRERRATKLVAIVMVVFLAFWLPFFTLNMYKLYRLHLGTWRDSLEVWFLAFTWLGYFNSCINPVIYAAINERFRRAFRKILCLDELRKRSSIWFANAQQQTKTPRHRILRLLHWNRRTNNVTIEQTNQQKRKRFRKLHSSSSNNAHCRTPQPPGPAVDGLLRPEIVIESASAASQNNNNSASASSGGVRPATAVILHSAEVVRPADEGFSVSLSSFEMNATYRRSSSTVTEVPNREQMEGDPTEREELLKGTQTLLLAPEHSLCPVSSSGYGSERYSEMVNESRRGSQQEYSPTGKTSALLAVPVVSSPTVTISIPGSTNVLYLDDIKETVVNV